MTEEIVLESRLDLSASEALAARLAGLRGRDVALDGAGVAHLGAHAAQTLLIARNTWSRDGHALTVRAPSAALLSDWAEMGLDAAHVSGEEPGK